MRFMKNNKIFKTMARNIFLVFKNMLNWIVTKIRGEEGVNYG